jgi:hypothetical protein
MIMEPKPGGEWGRGKYRKKIREVVKLSNGWYLIKTDNSKSKDDFKVKTIFSLSPPKTLTPKHAHFAIDFYGKVCADKSKAGNVLKAIIEMWSGKDIQQILRQYNSCTSGLPGYSLEYILYALKWILEQEDINFTGRSEKKQEELDTICKKQNIQLLPARKGSHLAVALLCDIMNGTHPVEALLKGNLDIRPRG